jgi:hypothetical protein
VERGEISTWYETTTVFVFEGLLAHCTATRREAAAVKAQQWEWALGYWEWDVQVLDHLHDMMARFQSQIEVVTWHPPGFATVLRDRIWELAVPVSDCFSALSYGSLSQHLATDRNVTAVYDPDPQHRFGYGFKCRDFTLGQM